MNRDELVEQALKRMSSGNSDDMALAIRDFKLARQKSEYYYDNNYKSQPYYYKNTVVDCYIAIAEILTGISSQNNLYSLIREGENLHTFLKTEFPKIFLKALQYDATLSKFKEWREQKMQEGEEIEQNVQALEKVFLLNS
ncbi:MAG: hypothetical protein EAZ97_13390 [Bacteroidetes bacterium]|nr:MAG: hypothetical protein EAZ97_13390 [Bacteroidota bacterium]